MICYSNGDIFTSGADILVNPVNCIGVMGAGLAKKFKRRFPKDFEAYAEACKLKVVALGHGLWTSEHGQEIFHFPTKHHWRDKSQLTDICSGLGNLRQTLLKRPATESIAIPALGCGLGGLAWNGVDATIRGWFQHYPGDVIVFPPK